MYAVYNDLTKLPSSNEVNSYLSYTSRLITKDMTVFATFTPEDREANEYEGNEDYRDKVGLGINLPATVVYFIADYQQSEFLSCVKASGKSADLKGTFYNINTGRDVHIYVIPPSNVKSLRMSAVSPIATPTSVEATIELFGHCCGVKYVSGANIPVFITDRLSIARLDKVPDWCKDLITKAAEFTLEIGPFFMYYIKKGHYYRDSDVCGIPRIEHYPALSGKAYRSRISDMSVPAQRAYVSVVRLITLLSLAYKEKFCRDAINALPIQERAQFIGIPFMDLEVSGTTNRIQVELTPDTCVNLYTINLKGTPSYNARSYCGPLATVRPDTKVDYMFRSFFTVNINA